MYKMKGELWGDDIINPVICMYIAHVIYINALWNLTKQTNKKSIITFVFVCPIFKNEIFSSESVL